MTPNCGTTFLSLSLTNYITNKLHQKAIYIEVNGTNEIKNLFPKSPVNSFHFMGLFIFSNVTLAELPTILSQPSANLILDFGVLNEHTLQAFSQADTKIIIGNIGPWKTRTYADYLKKLSNIMNIRDCFILLANLGIKEYEKIFHAYTGFSVLSIPYIKNPFQLTPADWPFFEILLKRI